MCAATLVWFRLDLRWADNPALAAAAARGARVLPVFICAPEEEGDCVRRWVPEIDAPRHPRPIVNHAQARERALEALAGVKQL